MWENVYIGGHVILVLLFILQNFVNVHILRSALLGIFFLNKASQNSVFITQCILVGQL